MFIDNKYKKWYYQIINRAFDRTLSEYTEQHHIIPRSLGGTNNKINLVNLTAREHLICHMLLPKMVSGNSYHKMINALWAMSKLKNKYHRGRITSKIYEKLKKDRSKVLSEMYKGKNNPFHGKNHSEDTKEKMRGRVVSEATKELISVRQKTRFSKMPGTFFGKTHNNETKEKIRQSRIGKKDSEETRIKKSIAGKNKPPVSAETRDKLSKINKGRPGLVGEKNGFFGKHHSAEYRAKKREEKLAAPKIVCYHCNKEVDAMNYGRWHGDKCRQQK
jgi:hypothetical protein